MKPLTRIAARLTRRERIKLLLGSYLAASQENRPRPAVRDSKGKPGSRTLGYGDLWYSGSYSALGKVLDELRSRSTAAPKPTRPDREPGHFASVYWHTLEWYVEGHQAKPVQRRKADVGVEFIHKRMPNNVYVPQAISENAGFAVTEAKAASRPKEREAA